MWRNLEASEKLLWMGRFRGYRFHQVKIQPAKDQSGGTDEEVAGIHVDYWMRL